MSSIPPQNTSPRFYIPSLDGIRGIAILLVFFSHAGLDRIIPGGLGVTIFFFLSGYLITTLLRRELEGTGHIDFKQFYIRRMLRIWPAFYFVLIAGAALTVFGFLPGVIQPTPLLSQILHFGNYYAIFHGNAGTSIGTGIYWSLAVEEHFYLVFPFVYYLVVKVGVKARGQMLILMFMCVAFLAWRYVLVVEMDMDDHRSYYASDTRVDSILYGSMLAILGNPVMDRVRFSDRVWKLFLVPASLALIAFTLLYRSPDFRETVRYSLQGIALYPLFTAAIRHPDWLPFRILNTRVVRFFGWISYPLYLVHFTVLRAFLTSSFHPVVEGALSFVVSIILAYAIYRLIEQPIAKLRKKHSHPGPSQPSGRPEVILAGPAVPRLGSDPAS
ncbi:acyltransferase [Luteolibacter yonseiensis]|uniref:Acyltransferase n=1 Tax=Luteolibacter yonseiensis TaxID=1144680 RepID=A0A934R4R0_9BACT|nr:acyltransferase [Luteolibacter yonseiensis]MBK1815149.1 acyltransferase [Luteolibacter yonseiensis]